jgi:flagellar protein FliS
MNTGVNAYQSVGASGAVGGASREQLVQMLLDGALTRIATAKGHIQRGEAAQKGEQIGKAISIVEGLKASLNPEAGEISANLGDLYSYISGRLLTASTSEDTAILDEVGDLLREIKSAWDVLASQPGTQGAA